MTARSDRDLTPDSIVQKVSDASGSKYTGGALAANSSAPPPPVFSKPAFTPTRSSAGGGVFNPLARPRVRSKASQDTKIDEDGWGQDAPPVTRTQLEKVQSSYQPTKVDMQEFSSQKSEPSHFNDTRINDTTSTESGVIKGGYQPVGRVDIGALRRHAQETGNNNDNKPNVVKGSYEPVGKVDIAAIRARAQEPSEAKASPPSIMSSAKSKISFQHDDQDEEQKPLPDRSAPFLKSERLTSLPKPKVANRFGPGTTTFTGTRAPTPRGFGLESKSATITSTVGVGRTFADQGGKTPAQLWAEKKARERRLSGAGDNAPPGIGRSASSIADQKLGEWKSSYGGKSWAPVQTTPTGQSAGSLSQERTTTEDEDQEEASATPVSKIGVIRDQFKGIPAMGAADVASGRSAPNPPPLDTASKPNASRGIPIPGLSPRPLQSHKEDENQEAPSMPTPPPQPPRSPSPPTPPAIETSSPIRVAIPVGRGHNEQEVQGARDEQFSPPPSMPTRSLAHTIPREEDLTEEPSGHDPARGAGEAAAAASFGGEAIEAANLDHESGKRAVVQYDYEKAEDNELELKEGEFVSNIEMVDEDWWMGENPRGEKGLFPSNYVELVYDEGDHSGLTGFKTEAEPQPGHRTGGANETSQGTTATALYDYEAAEGNELSFPENARIVGVVSQSVTRKALLRRLMIILRSFQTKIGGLVNMEGSRASFPPTTSGWTSET